MVGLKKPFLNVKEDAVYQENNGGSFRDSVFGISEKIGAQKLGYSVMLLEPGYKACPFHNHHVSEEMFFVLSGSGVLRFGPDRHKIKEGDIIACPPGGRELAHQIINDSEEELRVLCVSTREHADVCEYPDSDKVLAMVGEEGNRSFRHISRIKDSVDYFEGES